MSLIKEEEEKTEDYLLQKETELLKKHTNHKDSFNTL